MCSILFVFTVLCRQFWIWIKLNKVVQMYLLLCCIDSCLWKKNTRREKLKMKFHLEQTHTRSLLRFFSRVDLFVAFIFLSICCESDQKDGCPVWRNAPRNAFLGVCCAGTVSPSGSGLSGVLLKGNVPNQEKLNTVRFCCFKFVFAVFQSMHVEFMNVYKFTDLYKTWISKLKKALHNITSKDPLR